MDVVARQTGACFGVRWRKAESGRMKLRIHFAPNQPVTLPSMIEVNPLPKELIGGKHRREY